MIQRRVVVGIVLAAFVPLLSACGFEAPAIQNTEQASVQATDFHVGVIRVADTSITSVTPSSGIPRFFLVVTIVNNGARDDTLTGVTTPQGTITLSGPGTTNGTIVVPPGVPVEIDTPSPSSFGPVLSVSVSPQPIVGAFVPVVFRFATAGPSATVQVPVIPPGETTAPTQAIPTTQATAPAEVGDSAGD